MFEFTGFACMRAAFFGGPQSARAPLARSQCACLVLLMRPHESEQASNLQEFDATVLALPWASSATATVSEGDSVYRGTSVDLQGATLKPDIH